MKDVITTCPKCGRDISQSSLCANVECLSCGEKPAAATPDSAETADYVLPGVDTDATQTGVAPTLKKIGRFEIRRWLGEGAFGAVYEAYDPQLDRAVAIKVAKLGRGDSEQRIKRFLREAKAAAGLRHPHIVPVYEFGQVGDQFYIVSSFIQGRTLQADLAERNRKHQPIDLRRAARIVRQLADALAYAHGQGIVHRDVKPANIMLDDKDEPMLMDFGLASRQEDAERITHVGTVLGTPLYMAPEQARGQDADALPASDQYSVGVIVYEMFAGQAPFTGTPELVMYQHMETEPASTRTHNQAIPRDLETICLKCLEKQPAKRYADCRALAVDLNHWLEGEPIAARPIGSIERVRKWSARNPLPATLVGAVMATLLVGTTVASYFAYVANQHEAFAVEEAGKAKDAARKESIARLAADERREQAETLAARIEYEHYFSKIDDRSHLALVGIASVLPKSALLKDRSLEDSIRLQLRAWSGNAAQLQAICMHPSEVVAVTVSANGKTALTGSRGKTARLWDVDSGMPIGPPLQHQGEVFGIALSADGAIALTGSWDRTAQLWNATTGQPMGPPLMHRGWVNAAALSADGKIALTGCDANTAHLWDTATGLPIGPPLQHQKHVRSVALSADGKVALTGSWDGTARLWETVAGTPIGPPLKHDLDVAAVAISGDGKIVLTGSEDKTARLWDTATGKPIGPPLQLFNRVTAVALSADGKIAVTGSFDTMARLWDTSTGKPIGIPLPHQNSVTHVALSADGKIAITGSVDKMALLWDTATAKPIGLPLQHRETVRSVDLSADGSVVLTTSEDKSLRMWRTAQVNLLPPLPHKSSVRAIALSDDGTLAVTGSWDKTARVWDTATANPIGPTLSHQKAINAVALSANKKVVITGSADNTAQRWDASTGKPIGAALVHPAEVRAVALNFDATQALTGCRDNKVRRPGKIQPINDDPASIWDIKADAPIATRLPVLGDFRALALSTDGKFALTSSADLFGQVWDAATGKPIGAPLPHQALIGAFALSTDGKLALTGSYDKTARLWETATGKPIGPPLQHQDSVFAVALSADGKTALTGCRDNTARLWNTATGQPIGPPLTHQDVVRAVALSADGTTAVTAGADKTVRLWQAATGKPIGPPFRHKDDIMVVALSADGKIVLSGSEDKTARVWRSPQPFRSDPERIALWTQVITGIEVDALTVVRVLDADTWNERRARLEKLGGPPTQ